MKARIREVKKLGEPHGPLPHGRLRANGCWGAREQGKDKRAALSSTLTGRFGGRGAVRGREGRVRVGAGSPPPRKSWASNDKIQLAQSGGLGYRRDTGQEELMLRPAADSRGFRGASIFRGRCRGRAPMCFNEFSKCGSSSGKREKDGRRVKIGPNWVISNSKRIGGRHGRFYREKKASSTMRTSPRIGRIGPFARGRPYRLGIHRRAHREFRRGSRSRCSGRGSAAMPRPNPFELCGRCRVGRGVNIGAGAASTCQTTMARTSGRPIPNIGGMAAIHRFGQAFCCWRRSGRRRRRKPRRGLRPISQGMRRDGELNAGQRCQGKKSRFAGGRRPNPRINKTRTRMRKARPQSMAEALSRRKP